jgi:hypothetical protein
MDSMTGERAGDELPQDGSFRRYIALWVLAVGTVALTILATVMVLVAPAAQKVDVSRDIFFALLPVVAAWVGTVLAFYFGQSNFEVASRQARASVRVGLTPEEQAKTKVASIMRPVYDTTMLTMDQPPSAYVLQQLLLDPLSSVDRLPIVDASANPLFMIHKSRVTDYLTSHPASDTLEQFLAAEAAKSPPVSYGPGAGFVLLPITASVAQAKAALDSNPAVSDIFVTKTGAATEPLLGWISNNRLQENLRA